MIRTNLALHSTGRCLRNAKHLPVCWSGHELQLTLLRGSVHGHLRLDVHPCAPGAFARFLAVMLKESAHGLATCQTPDDIVRSLIHNSYNDV